MGISATYRALLTNRPLLRFLLGEFVSSAGNGLYTVAIMVYVFERTRSGLALGVIGAALLLPFLVLTAPAGSIADRFDRRRVLIATDLVRAVAVLLMVGAVAVDGPVAVIVGLALVVAVVSAFFGPAFGAFLPDLVIDERQFASANGAWAALENAALVAGPALGGVLISVGGTALALLGDIGTFAVVIAILTTLPSRHAHHTALDAASVPDHLSSRFILSRLRPAAGPLIAQVGVAFSLGGLLVLAVLVASRLTDGGDPAVGYLMSALGVGGVFGGLIAGPLGVRHLPIALAVATLLTGSGFVLLGLVERLPLAAFSIGLAGSGAVVVEILMVTAVQRAARDEYRGRALGLAQTSGWSAYAAGQLLMPAAAGAFGLDFVLIVAGASVVVVGLIGAAIAGSDRRSDHAEIAEREWIAELDLFRGLAAEQLAGVRTSLEAANVRPGETIIRQGDRADRLYIVDSGIYDVIIEWPDGHQQHIRQLRARDFFGELGLLDGGYRTASVTAVESGSLLSLSGDRFLQLVAERPSVRTYLLGRYAG
ncbi:MAG: MFS transporter [Chloroflexota bacterium]|nr:MFS transporter [Chloroflexota bacterium]